MSRPGTASGPPRPRPMRLWESSTPQRSAPWQMPACASASPTSAWTSHRAHSRPRRRWAPSTRPRSRSGGQSSRRPTSSRIDRLVGDPPTPRGINLSHWPYGEIAGTVWTIHVDRIHLFTALVGVFDMKDARRATLDFEIIVNGFDVMGRYLRDQCSLVGEIAVYGGTAMLLQFAWRKMTEDVEVTILTSERESAVKDAAAFAAVRLGLPDDWLNNYVGGFTPETESQALFSTHGVYPRGETPGLRVFLAKPEYLC